MIALTIPYFPPTTNKAYFHRFGRLHLSDTGRKFKEEVTNYVARHYPKELKSLKKDTPYLLYLRVFFDSLENKGWGKNKGTSRYKKFDASNRIKLAEDALVTAFGIDDSQFIAVCVQKHEGGPDVPEHFEAFVWDLEAERSPLDGFQRIC